MSASFDGGDAASTSTAAARNLGGATSGDAAAGQGYEAPRIVWREPYEPLSFGISCAKQPGNPGCNPGPFSS